MATKNILVTANYKITEEMYNKKKSKTEDYEEITSLCLESFHENLKDINEVVILKGIKKSYHEMFKEIFYKTKEIHYNNNINMLFVDSDNVCVKPTWIFNDFDEFNMFMNLERTRICKYPDIIPKEYYEDLNPWFMSNVRYFPSTFIMQIWDNVQFLVDNWKNTWAYECIIYNRMFKQQILSKKLENYFNPRYNFQLNAKFMNRDFKQCDANILHVHSSRGSKECIEIMKKLINKKV